MTAETSSTPAHGAGELSVRPSIDTKPRAVAASEGDARQDTPRVDGTTAAVLPAARVQMARAGAPRAAGDGAGVIGQPTARPDAHAHDAGTERHHPALDGEPVPAPARSESTFELTPDRRAGGTRAMRITSYLARLLGRLLTRLEVDGLEHVPSRGAVLFAVNHSAFIDGPLVYGIVRRPVVFLIKSEMFVGLAGRVLRRIGQIPVRRGLVEREPLRVALATLTAGGAVGVFPEGTRGQGQVERIERGIGYLALRSASPVVPVACHGTARLLPHGRRFPHWRPRVRVVFGAPVTVAGGRAATRAAVSAATEQIRAALATHVRSTASGGGRA
jgi:1-acyl-sn-glycerol-3-phosphate acyltransferase